jgi:hypothetical protein
MSRQSQLKQRQAELEHQRQQDPRILSVPTSPVQIDIASLVPMLMQSGQLVAYGIDGGHLADGRPYVRIGLQIGPIVIPCMLTLDEARIFNQNLEAEICKWMPKPIPDETEGAVETSANLGNCKSVPPE